MLDSKISINELSMLSNLNISVARYIKKEFIDFLRFRIYLPDNKCSLALKYKTI